MPLASYSFPCSSCGRPVAKGDAMVRSRCGSLWVHAVCGVVPSGPSGQTFRTGDVIIETTLAPYAASAPRRPVTPQLPPLAGMAPLGAAPIPQPSSSPGMASVLAMKPKAPRRPRKIKACRAGEVPGWSIAIPLGKPAAPTVPVPLPSLAGSRASKLSGLGAFMATTHGPCACGLKSPLLGRQLEGPHLADCQREGPALIPADVMTKAVARWAAEDRAAAKFRALLARLAAMPTPLADAGVTTVECSHGHCGKCAGCVLNQIAKAA